MTAKFTVDAQSLLSMPSCAALAAALSAFTSACANLPFARPLHLIAMATGSKKCSMLSIISRREQRLQCRRRRSRERLS